MLIQPNPLSLQRRAAQMHDIFTEMDHRQDILDNHLDEYMSLAQSMSDSTTFAAGSGTLCM